MTVEGLAARIFGTDVISDAMSWYPVVDPSDQAQIAITGSASRADVATAVEAAHAAWQEWRHKPTLERAVALRALASDLRADADSLAHTITAETGKLLWEAQLEIDLSCRYLEWFASIVPTHESSRSGARALVTRHPVGVVAAITTWNFPLSIPVRKPAPALAAGCAVVLKPSPLSPLTALELVRRCERYLPPGVVGLVLSDQEQGRDMVEIRLSRRSPSPGPRLVVSTSPPDWPLGSPAACWSWVAAHRSWSSPTRTSNGPRRR